MIPWVPGSPRREMDVGREKRAMDKRCVGKRSKFTKQRAFRETKQE